MRERERERERENCQLVAPNESMRRKMHIRYIPRGKITFWWTSLVRLTFVAVVVVVYNFMDIFSINFGDIFDPK